MVPALNNQSCETVPGWSEKLGKMSTWEKKGWFGGLYMQLQKTGLSHNLFFNECNCCKVEENTTKVNLQP